MPTWHVVSGDDAELHYFTGSKPHNIAIRTLGRKRGVKINEYGIVRGTRHRPHAVAPDRAMARSRGFPPTDAERTSIANTKPLAQLLRLLHGGRRR